MFFECRRPIPRKARSIGRWKVVLLVEAVAAVIVTSGFVVLSTGQLEQAAELFVPGICPTVAGDNAVKLNKMKPYFECFDWTVRLVVFTSIETLGLLVFLLMLRRRSKIPPEVARELDVRKCERRCLLANATQAC